MIGSAGNAEVPEAGRRHVPSRFKASAASKTGPNEGVAPALIRENQLE
jgi:hypothetical protein